MPPNRIAVLLLIAGGSTWALTPLLVELTNLGLFPTLWGRALTTALFLWIGIRAKILLSTNEESNWKKEVSIGIWSAASTGFFVAACVLTTPIRVYALFYLFPLYSVVLDLVIGRKKKDTQVVKQLLVVSLATVGVVVFASSEWGNKPFGLGELFAICSSLVWLVYSKLACNLETDLQSLRAVMKSQLVLAVIFSAFVIKLGVTEGIELPKANQIFWIIVLGAATAMPLFAWGWAARYIKPHIAGAITQIEAPLGVIAMYLFIGTPIDLVASIGGLIIICSSVLAVLSEKS